MVGLISSWVNVSVESIFKSCHPKSTPDREGTHLNKYVSQYIFIIGY